MIYPPSGASAESFAPPRNSTQFSFATEFLHRQAPAILLTSQGNGFGKLESHLNLASDRGAQPDTPPPSTRQNHGLKRNHDHHNSNDHALLHAYDAETVARAQTPPEQRRINQQSLDSLLKLNDLPPLQTNPTQTYRAPSQRCSAFRRGRNLRAGHLPVLGRVSIAECDGCEDFLSAG